MSVREQNHVLDQFRLEIREAGRDDRHDTLFQHGFDEAFRTAAHMYYRLFKCDLAESDARLAVMYCTRTGEAISGARAFRDPAGILQIGAAWTREDERGHGLIGTVVDALRLSFFADPKPGYAPVTDAILDVRIRDGEADPSATRAYQRIGFTVSRIKRVVIHGTDRDRHLSLTADADGLFSTQLMTASLDSLERTVARIAAHSVKCAA